MPQLEIEFIPEYDEYGGVFIVRCGNKSEECPTLDDALHVAKTWIEIELVTE
jgi:hypothetical protein